MPFHLAAGSRRAFDAAHGGDVPLSRINVLALKDLQSLPDALDGLTELADRVGDGDSAVREKRAEADPGLDAARGDVDHAGIMPPPDDVRFLAAIFDDHALHRDAKL